LPTHPSLSMEVLKTGIVPTLNEEEWISNEIPYSKEEIDRVFPNRSMTFPLGAWFFKQTGQSYLFTPQTACMITPVELDEVRKAIAIANALKNTNSRGKLN